MFADTALVFAHQGGWDEILWVLVPIAVMVWLLRVATRRISKERESVEHTDVGTETGETTD
jgi:hypothetical protein